MKKFLIFSAILMPILYINTAMGACPSGLFCTNGDYSDNRLFHIPSHLFGPAELGNTIDWIEEGLCSGSGCRYNEEDYDEVWITFPLGFYLVKNGEVTYKSALDSAFPGVFSCPGTYPSSDAGASSVFQCYRIVSNNQKEYYKAPNANQPPRYDGNYNTDDVNAMLTTLQTALDQANTAAQNLQNLLKKSNNKINVKSSIETIATLAKEEQADLADVETDINPKGNTNGAIAPAFVAPKSTGKNQPLNRAATSGKNVAPMKHR